MGVAPGEPAAAGWRTRPLASVATELAARGPGPVRIVAIDGRGGAGKTTLAAAVAASAAGAVVVHTDDLAWNEPLFGWGRLLLALLEDVRAGRPVVLVPPAWQRHGRSGSIEVAAGVPLLVVEGNGAAQQAVAHLLDAAVWVQSDDEEAERLALERDVRVGDADDAAAAKAFWDGWQVVERPFFAADRPWRRADLIAAGNGVGPAVPPGSVAVVDGPLPG